MTEFFARLYEWFGFIPLYSRDMGNFLRGWDFACSGYFAVPWYVYIGWLMIVLTTVIYALQYDLVDSGRFNKWQHWGLVALSIVILNFVAAFTIPFITLETGGYCQQLKMSVIDCIGFGLSNATWSLVLFIILTTVHPLKWFLEYRRRVISAKQ